MPWGDLPWLWKQVQHGVAGPGDRWGWSTKLEVEWERTRQLIGIYIRYSKMISPTNMEIGSRYDQGCVPECITSHVRFRYNWKYNNYEYIMIYHRKWWFESDTVVTFLLPYVQTNSTHLFSCLGTGQKWLLMSGTDGGKFTICQVFLMAH